MGFTKTSISVILLSIFCVTLMSQEQQYNLRSLNINLGDSTIKAQTSNTCPGKKLKPQTNYYWYAAGKIHNNVGSFSGKLLHGKYEVFDKSNNLIVQGIFDYGLKQGTWNKWHPNGLKKEIVNYEKGTLEGENLIFNSQGLLIIKKSFKKGRLDGKSIFYTKDSIIVKQYKNGKELVPKMKIVTDKKDSKKLKKPEIEIKKEQTTLNDSIPSTNKSRFFNFKKSRKQKTVKNEKG